MILELCDLKKSYGKNPVLCGLNVSLETGVHVLLGPNGSGKTTLIRIIADILPMDGGSVAWNGENIGRAGREYRRILGYMPQLQKAYDFFTVYQFMNYMALMKEIPGNKMDETIRECLKKVNMLPFADVKMGGLSGGMRQRVQRELPGACGAHKFSLLS